MSSHLTSGSPPRSDTPRGRLVKREDEQPTCGTAVSPSMSAHGMRWVACAVRYGSARIATRAMAGRGPEAVQN